MRRLTAILVLGLMLGGCSSIPGLESVTGPGPDAAYLTAMDRWTREARIYNGFETVLFVSATFKSLPLRMAYVDEYTRVYGLLPKEEEKLSVDQARAAGEYLDFVMAAYLPDQKLNDFSAPKSIWAMYLENEKGIRVRPLEVRLLRQDEKALEHFYPYFLHGNAPILFGFPFG